jgi:hypothetical protein
MYAVPAIGFYLLMLAQLPRAARLRGAWLLMHVNLTKGANHRLPLTSQREKWKIGNS